MDTGDYGPTATCVPVTLMDEETESTFGIALSCICLPLFMELGNGNEMENNTAKCFKVLKPEGKNKTKKCTWTRVVSELFAAT